MRISDWSSDVCSSDLKPKAGDKSKAGDKPNTGYSACPHDCPSTCALEIDLLPEGRIGRVRGAPGNSYTAGVICAKVARYAERANHPDRLLHPLLRTGPNGSGPYTQISRAEALERPAEAYIESASRRERVCQYV